MGDRRLPPPRLAADDSADLMRLARFRAADPAWTIGYDGELRFWQAWKPAPDGGTLRTAYLLGELLDKLGAPDTG